MIADLYLPRDAGAAGSVAGAAGGELAAIESAGRFGARAALRHGWREWLVADLGRAELRGVAAARIAAAPLAQAVDATATIWIATPVHLTAGLTRVHLDHRGLLRLPPAELAALAADFRRTFGEGGIAIAPLASGDLLLATPGMAALATPEPARCAGGEVVDALPRGREAAPLRRLTSEIEMWLHSHPLNAERTARGELPVSALWLWGAAGRSLPPEPHVATDAPRAFGADAWLAGLWHLLGGAARPLPGHLEEVLGEDRAPRTVLVAEVGRELQRADGAPASAPQALARLAEHFVGPALRALRAGELTRVTLIVNDTRALLGRSSHWRFWRRRRAGLASFA